MGTRRKILSVYNSLPHRRAAIWRAYLRSSRATTCERGERAVEGEKKRERERERKHFGEQPGRDLHGTISRLIYPPETGGGKGQTSPKDLFLQRFTRRTARGIKRHGEIKREATISLPFFAQQEQSGLLPVVCSTRNPERCAPSGAHRREASRAMQTVRARAFMTFTV